MTLTSSQAEALRILTVVDFASGSTSNDEALRCIASGSGRRLEALGLAEAIDTHPTTGRRLLGTWYWRATPAGRAHLSQHPNQQGAMTTMAKKQSTAEALAEANATNPAGPGRLPRATCPTCTSDTALRKGGEFREHVTPIDITVDADGNDLAEPVLAGSKCPNSGQRYVEPAALPDAGTVEQPDADAPPADVTTLTLSLEAQAIADRRPGGAFSGAEAKVLDVDDIILDASNPRGAIDPNDPAILELAASIAVRGVLQPVIVYPSEDGHRYQLVAGHRRVVAARVARAQVPALVRGDYAGALELAKVDQIIENLHRSDLTPVQTAHAFEALRKAGMKQADIALAAGINQGTVSKRLALLKLPADVQRKVEAGTIDVAAAVDLAKLSKTDASEAAKSIERGARPDAAIASAQREAAIRETLDARVTELVAAGHTVIDYPQHGHWDDREDLPLIGVDSAGSVMGRPLGVQYSSRGYVDVTPDEHRSEPCDALAVGTGYNGTIVEVPICLDPQRHGPTTAEQRNATIDAERAAEQERREADQAARKARTDARWAATRAVVAAKLSRPVMVDTVAAWAVTMLLTNEAGYGSSISLDEDVWPGTLDLFGVDVPAEPDATDYDAERDALDTMRGDLEALIVSEGTLRVAFVACLAAGENLIANRGGVEDGSSLFVGHFRLLVEYGGHTMTDLDTRLVTAPPPELTVDEVLAAAGEPPKGAVALYVGDVDTDGDEDRWVLDGDEADAIADLVPASRLIRLPSVAFDNQTENQGGEHSDGNVSTVSDPAANGAAEAPVEPVAAGDGSTPPDAVDEPATPPDDGLVPGGPCPGSGSPTPASVASYVETECPKCGQTVKSTKNGKRVKHLVPEVAAV